MSHRIRPSTEADLIAACDVVKRSIRELCLADHRGDAAALDAWLSNKTPEQLSTYIREGGRFGFVALRAEEICGFGLLSPEGEIELCYIAPAVVGKGIGSELLDAMEQCAHSLGLEQVFLCSTATALGFYQSRGYEKAGEPVLSVGAILAQPMRKNLSL